MTWPLILAEYGGFCVLEDQDLVTETGREALVIGA
jgi:hypothetical protein